MLFCYCRFPDGDAIENSSEDGIGDDSSSSQVIFLIIPFIQSGIFGSKELISLFFLFLVYDVLRMTS